MHTRALPSVPRHVPIWAKFVVDGPILKILGNCLRPLLWSLLSNCPLSGNLISQLSLAWWFGFPLEFWMVSIACFRRIRFQIHLAFLFWFARRSAASREKRVKFTDSLALKMWTGAIVRHCNVHRFDPGQPQFFFKIFKNLYFALIYIKDNITTP